MMAGRSLGPVGDIHGRPAFGFRAGLANHLFKGCQGSTPVKTSTELDRVCLRQSERD